MSATYLSSHTLTPIKSRIDLQHQNLNQTTAQTTIMPLVVPGLQSKDGNDKSNDWLSKLAGKKIGDSSNETVRFTLPISETVTLMTLNQTFAKTDLPKEHRVVKEGDMMTQDHKPDRYVFMFEDSSGEIT
jgi:hypothetical protein